MHSKSTQCLRTAYAPRKHSSESPLAFQTRVCALRSSDANTSVLYAVLALHTVLICIAWQCMVDSSLRSPSPLMHCIENAMHALFFPFWPHIVQLRTVNCAQRTMCCKMKKKALFLGPEQAPKTAFFGPIFEAKKGLKKGPQKMPEKHQKMAKIRDF